MSAGKAELSRQTTELVSGRYTGTGMEWTMSGIVFPSYQEALQAAKRLIERRLATEQLSKQGQS